jgi:hypothetical protein
VWYLVAPLLEDDVGGLLGDFDLFHGALAFVNKRTNFTVTINYDAFDFVRASLFPLIVYHENGTRSVIWENGGASYIYMGINDTYWTTSVDKITTIDGSVYNSFLSDWNAVANATHPYYNLFAIREAWNDISWVPSWTCFDFVWDGFSFMAKEGSQFPNVTIKRDFSNFYSSQPPIDITHSFETNEVVRDAVIDFYEFIEVKLANMTLAQIVETVLDVFEGDFYLRSSESYYRLKLEFPYIGLDFLPSPLPSDEK